MKTSESRHKRTRTVDFKPQKNTNNNNNEYQLEKKFESLDFFKRKDSLPTKPGSPQLKEFTFSKKPTRIINTDQKPQIKPKASKLNSEYFKDISKIYKTNTLKTTRNYSDCQDLLEKQSNFLYKNLKSVDFFEKNEVSLSKEIFYSQDHKEMLLQVLKCRRSSIIEIMRKIFCLYP